MDFEEEEEAVNGIEKESYSTGRNLVFLSNGPLGSSTSVRRELLLGKGKQNTPGSLSYITTTTTNLHQISSFSPLPESSTPRRLYVFLPYHCGFPYRSDVSFPSFQIVFTLFF